jgi:threonine 3-dehydrogenase
MKILVTGAGGQVGLDLLRILQARGDEVHASDIALPPEALPAGRPWHQPRRHRRRPPSTRWSPEVRPEVVFHLAAILSARGEADPQRTYAVNQTGTLNVLEACRQQRRASGPLHQHDRRVRPAAPRPRPRRHRAHPTTMYGVTKVAGELLGDYYFRRYGLDFRAVRFPGLISAVLPGGGTSDYAPLMYYEALRVGHYEAFCRPDATIPLMYMPDALRALVELSQAPRERLSRSVYNVAAFSPTAREIADEVMRAVPGADITFKPDPARQAILDSWPRALDDRLARRDWGWAPRHDLQAMTADLLPKLRELLPPGAA